MIIQEYVFGKTHQRSKIPCRIWTFWHDDEIPIGVQCCINTWKKYNPNYTITILTLANIKRFIPSLPYFPPPHVILEDGNICYKLYSDYVRLFILEKYGGIWMDATCICNASLDWIHAIQNTTQRECIMYETHLFRPYSRSCFIPVVDSWFIACMKGCEFIQMWKHEFMIFATYQSRRAYIDSIDYDVNITCIPQQEKLIIYICAQVVLQRDNAFLNTIYTLNSEKGPYKYLKDHNWITKQAIYSLFQNKKYTKHPLIKLRSQEHMIFADFLRK